MKKQAFTMAGAGQRASLFGWMAHGRVAFTMAEILLSLTIIGVVAAITLPSLTGNINERTWNTQRKALYARMSQAIALMPALNGYGELDDTDSHNVAETFISAGLSKVLKINNICDSTHLGDCGLTSKFTDFKNHIHESFPATLVGYNSMFNGTAHNASGGVYNTYRQTDTKAAAFETANGESILVYYNPNCKPNNGLAVMHETQPYLCANFVYDLNGKKGPNTVGKDIGFMSALHPSDSIVVAPNFLPGKELSSADKTQIEAGAYCRSLDEDLRLPNVDEAASMFYNRMLLGYEEEEISAFWTSTVIMTSGGVSAWRQALTTGRRTPFS